VPLRVAETVGRWLTHPRLGVFLAILAVVLTLPSLGLGWQLDDHTYRFILLGEGPGRMTPLRTFDLLNGDPELNAELRDSGQLPWWASDTFRFSLFRYLSVLTMWLDYLLWPDSPVLMHAQSLLWFALLALAVFALYRQLFGATAVAGLAAVLYVLDDARAGPAVWLANRNALTAALFGVICLWAHDRWRRGGWKAGAVLAPLCLALSLASGEIGLGAAAYLAAHAAFLERGTLARRLAAVAPHGAVGALWAGIYRAFGYGVEGSSLYLDPVGDTPAYLRALPYRAAVELMGQWSPIPADAGAFVPDRTRLFMWIAAIGVIAIVAWAVAPLLRRDALSRFWGAGMLLSLLPVVSTFPSNRLLTFAGLGGMGLLAQFLSGVLVSADRLPRTVFARACARALAWAFVVTHLLIAPIGLALGSESTRMLGEAEQTAVATVPDDPAIADQDLVVVNAPDFLIYVAHIKALKHLVGKPYAPRIWALAPTPVPLTVSRPGERTLDIRMHGGLFAGPLGELFHDPRRLLLPGTRVELGGLTVTVLETAPSGDVLAARFDFAVPLEDGSLRLLRWEDGGYVPFAPPAVGRAVELPAARGVLDRFR